MLNAITVICLAVSDGSASVRSGGGRPVIEAISA